jgi:MoxR-like ATPase
MLADQTAPAGSPLETLAPVADAAELIAAVHACRTVHVAPSLHDYVVALCGATREDPRLALGASPRAGVVLTRLARAHALVRGRDHVLPDDVKELAPDALAHRLLPAAGRPADVVAVVEELLARVPVAL